MSCILPVSEINNVGPVAVVAHDAGGAEILSSFIKKNSLCAVCVISGPAVEIFKKKISHIRIASLRDALLVCEWVLTSTGNSDFEWQAIRMARLAGKKTVTFLDHWVRFKERFIRNGVMAYPDEIWVGDVFAYELARNLFTKIVVRLVDNPYYKHFIEEVENLGEIKTKSDKKRVLLLSENICRPEFSQIDAFNFFLDNMHYLGDQVNSVLIRPHPTERIDKYFSLRRKYGELLSFSSGGSLVEEVSASDIVVGCNTMAMVLAMLVNRRVVSCIPSDNVQMTLPFKEIESLLSLIGARRNVVSRSD